MKARDLKSGDLCIDDRLFDGEELTYMRVRTDKAARTNYNKSFAMFVIDMTTGWREHRLSSITYSLQKGNMKVIRRDVQIWPEVEA